MRFSIFLLAVFVLAACDDASVRAKPVYQPPQSRGGALCIVQCGKSRDYCAESCALDYHACYSDMQAQAEREFDAYARQRFDAHQVNDKSPSDFESHGACDVAQKQCLGDCAVPYKACYKSCGGQVSARELSFSFERKS